MERIEKRPLAVIYDKKTGSIVSIHQTKLLDKSQEVSRKEMITEAEKFAMEGKLSIPAEWGILLLEMTKKEIGNLISIDPATQNPVFWNILTQDISKKE